MTTDSLTFRVHLVLREAALAGLTLPPRRLIE